MGILNRLNVRYNGHEKVGSVVDFLSQKTPCCGILVDTFRIECLSLHDKVFPLLRRMFFHALGKIVISAIHRRKSEKVLVS